MLLLNRMTLMVCIRIVSLRPYFDPYSFSLALHFTAAWPSQIDEFVEWAKQQLSGEAMDES